MQISRSRISFSLGTRPELATLCHPLRKVCPAQPRRIPLCPRHLPLPHRPSNSMSAVNPELARIEPATLGDLDALVELTMELFQMEQDFCPDRSRQEHGLRLILEQPSRGRIFVVRTDHRIIGMANLLMTISTAAGGFALILEDVIIHPDHRGHGFGTLLMNHVINFAREKGFRRITLLTDKSEEDAQRFFQRFGFEFSAMLPMRLLLS